MIKIWNSLSIRYKLAIIVFLIVMAVIITTFPITSKLIKHSLLTQQEEHLISVKNLVIKLFEDYQNKVKNYTRLFSNDRELKNTLFYHTELSGEREHPLRAVERLFETFDVNSIEVTDSKGYVVAVAENPTAFGQNRSSDSLILSSLKGEVGSGIELTEKGFLIKASAPIYYNENQILGVITSGILLDNILLMRIKQLSNTDIVVLDNKDNIISTTKVDLLWEKKFPKDLPGKQNYLMVGFQLMDMSGNVIGNVKILQKNKLPEIIARAHLTFIIVLGIVSILSVLALFMVLNKTMSPILRLKEGAEKIGRREFGHRISITSQDEFGELSKTFNNMAQSLENLYAMEEKLRQSEKLAAIGTFAAGIAHEINNPIGNIIGISKLMLKSIVDDSEKEDIETIIKNAERCAIITKDLLVYSRQSSPEKELLSVRELMGEVVNTVKRHIDSKKIEFEIDIDDNLKYIYADPLQINQVLNNILINAVQSIELSGRITLRAVPLNDDTVEISISDTGCGIDEDIKDKIFYPFFSTKKVGEGTGLGLAISYSIIQNHGGEIFVESQKGVGSTFVIKLPVDKKNG